MSSLKQWGAWGWMLGTALLVGCGPEEDKLQLEFIQPEELAATNRELFVALRLLGGPPDRVALYVDETWVANLDASNYVVDTRAWSEGEHTLTARATLGTELFTSKGRKVMVDRTPPEVVSVTPESGATNVPVDAPLTVVFSEPLSPSALQSVELEVGGSGEGPERLKPRELSPDGRTLVFSPPSRPFVPPRTVSAVLVGRVEDRVGNALLPMRDSGWSWQVPVFLSLGDPMAGLDTVSRPFAEWPTLRLDAQGRPMVAWSASSSARSVRVRRWDGSQWVSLPSGPPFDAGSTTHIELDAQGRPTVTWVHGSPTSTSSWIGVYQLEGETWKQLTRVGPNPTGPFPSVDRAVGRLTSSGLVKVAWKAQANTPSGHSEVMFASQSTSESWGFLSYSTSATGWQELAMDMNDTGVAVTAWCERVDDAGLMRLGVQRWSESPMPTLTALPARSDVHNPAVVVQRDGNPVVAWGERGAVQVHRWTGTAWEQLGQPVPTPVTPPAGIAVSGLALDASGRLVLAWSVLGKVEVWRWTGNGWVRWAEISQPTSATLLPGTLSLQLDETGAPVLVWSQRSSPNFSSGFMEVFRLNR